MQMDLVRALDAAASEPSTSARPSDGAEFPNVLESSLASAGDGRDTPSEEHAEAPREGEDEEAAAGEGARADDSSAQEDARAAAESGAPAVAAAGLAERARALAIAESERETEGRPSDLAAGDGAAGEDERTDAATDTATDLDTTVARAVEGAVAAEADAAGEEVATNARVATEQGMPTASQVAPEVAEVEDAEDRGSEREDVSLAQAGERASQEREQAAQDPGFERAAADRALDEATSGTVDPVLRQQIDDRAAVQRAPEVASVDGAVAVASPVAGLVTETTTPAAPGTPSPVVASEAIAVQTEWLATRGGGTARLVLHPPELGEMAIRVTLRGGAVDVVMVAQEAMAAGVADEQSERLAQAFAGRDLRLDQFEVRRGDPGALDLDSDGRFAESGAGDGREARGDEADRDGRGGRGRPGTRGDGSEPTPVPRIATIVADTGGVDLRI